MKENTIEKGLASAVAACISAQIMLSGAQPIREPFPCSADAVGSYENAAVANLGMASGDAYIRGRSASVVHDSVLDSDVLKIGGDSFGAGWLELPQLFDTRTDNGFTIALDFKLDDSAETYTRLFQLSAVPFGTGAVPSYSSPDISVDLNNKETFRASIFAGTGFKAQSDARAIFNVNASPDSGKWHKLCASYSPDGASFYIDGKLLDTTADEKLADALSVLFSGDTLTSYRYNSIGHSIYSDHDIRASVDNIAFYDRALTADQTSDLPDDASYLFTFEPDTITESSVPTAETTMTFNGVSLKSVPELQTASPDGSLITKLWTDNGGSFYYTVEKSGYTVIEPSMLGIVTDSEDLSKGFSADIASVSRISYDESYSMPNGKHISIRNNYNELSFPLIKGKTILTVIIRMYNDGFACRYALDHSASIKEEMTQIVFPEKAVFWGNMPNATYEWEISEFPMENVTKAWSDYSVPFMCNIDSKYWTLVSEAAVINEDEPYCGSCLRTTGGSRALSWKGGVKVKSISFGSSFRTPWRAIIIADNLSDMSTSDLILNLNPPSVIGDTSWIKPGKVAWSWWSSGGDSPIEYHNQKDYIDFAAENGWDHVCLDFGWALWDNSADKVKELCEYGASKGIGIFLWYGVNNTGHSGYKDSAGHPAYPYYSLLDEETIVREFERIKSLGVSGVKVDYYESDTQETMKQMHLCAEYAAKNKLMVLFHGCTMPRGESRTYPHVISHEAISGTEFYKWFDTPSLTNRITYTFLRNTVGSADFTSTGIPIPGIRATAGFALADVVNIESGVQHFAHSVYTYEGNEALPFLNDVPVIWDGMKVIDGYPMKFNVTARRSGHDWYIGASTIDARKITIPLSELITDDDVYTAYIYGDNEDGSRIKVTTLTGLTKESTIVHDLLPNGGCTMKITPTTMKQTTEYSDYVFFEAENAQLSGRAEISEGKYCSNGAYVGYVGGGAGNSVTFENIKVDRAGEYKLRIYFISGETRSLMVGVNGEYSETLDGLFANKNDWKGISGVSTTVKLKEGMNTITLYNDKGYGPSIDRIAIDMPSNDMVIPGDLNFDGVVDTFDSCLMRKVIENGSDDAKVMRAADFNCDGKVDEYDLIAHGNFILGK